MNGSGFSQHSGGITSASSQEDGGGAEVIGRGPTSCDLPATGLIISTESTTTIIRLPPEECASKKSVDADDDAILQRAANTSNLSEAIAPMLPLTDQLQQVFPIAKYTCELCCAICATQFSFFKHLQSHYETVPSSASDNCAADNKAKRGSKQNGKVVTASEVTQVTGSSCTKRCSTLKGPINQVPSSSNAVQLIENAENIVQDTDQPVSNAAVTSANVATNSSSSAKVKKSSNTKFECPNCRKCFRKEKNFAQHNCKSLPTDKPGGYHDEGTSCPDHSVTGLIEGCQNLSIPLNDLKSVTDCIETDSIVKFGPGVDGQDDDEIDYDAYLPVGGEDEEEEETEMMYIQSNICPSCDEHFESKENLDDHITQTHPEICAIGGVTDTKVGVKQKKPGFSDPLSSVPKKSGIFQCQQCLRIFNHRNSLVYHLRSHSGERPYKCDNCEKRFFATSALKVHQRVHSGLKPYACKECPKRFRQWGDLKYHETSIHSNTRAFQCEYCGKDFARKYSLTVHRRIHTNERNYKCDICGKCFRASSYLQNHRRIHTGEKNHTCQICGKPFRVRSDMNRHYTACLRKNPSVAIGGAVAVATIPAAASLEPEPTSKILPVISAPSGIRLLQSNSSTTTTSASEVTYSILSATSVDLVHENLFAFATS